MADLSKLYGNWDVTNELISLVAGKIEELRFDIEISAMLQEARNRYNIRGYVNSMDIDKIIRVEDDYRAIFDLKISHNGKLKIKFSQDKSLRLISEKLGIPVYYVVKSPYGYHIIRQDSEQYLFVKGKLGLDCYLNLEQYQAYDRKRLVERLADVLRGVEDESLIR